MNRAFSSTSASVTVVPKQSQLFQPIGGRVVGGTVTLAPLHVCVPRSAATEDRLYACWGRNAEPVSPRLEPVGPVTTGTLRPAIVAVGATADAPAVVEAAAGIARDQHTRLEVVHIRETAVVEEQAIDVEDVDAARAAVTAHLDRLAGHGVPVTGLLLHSVGDHAAAGRVLAGHASDVAAQTIAVGRSPRGSLVQFADGSLTAAVTSAAPCPVVFVQDGTPHPLTPQTLHHLRTA